MINGCSVTFVMMIKPFFYFPTMSCKPVNNKTQKCNQNRYDQCWMAFGKERVDWQISYHFLSFI